MDIEKAISFMEQIADDNSHGYAQDRRGGNPDYDCSSLVSDALNRAGFNVKKLSTTRTLYSQLKACGFKELSITAPRQRGDIFLTPGKHVVMCSDSDNIVHASINEKGGISNGKVGDQTGKEICRRTFYNPSYGWKYHLRFGQTLSKKYQYGLDVNEAQGLIDWEKVKESGRTFACMRSTRKSFKPDAYFERNLAECIRLRIDYSCFKYCYATTEAQAMQEADSVINLLHGRSMMVWYDIEDAILKPLTKAELEKVIKAFINRCNLNGIKVGIYTYDSLYKTHISDFLKKNYLFWISRYGKNDGTLNENYKPSGEWFAWQYTSKGRIPGINGDVDLDVM